MKGYYAAQYFGIIQMIKLKNSFTASTFFLLLALSFNASAEDPLVVQLEQFLKSTQTLEASFKQRVDAGRGDYEDSTGRFYLQKPDLFRWDYLKPYHQEIVSDGERIWYFDADLEQVTVKPFKAMHGSALLLLLGKGTGLEDKFDIQVIGRLSDDARIRLLPKSDGQGVEQILVGMKNGQLSSLALKDPFGQMTNIEFKSIKKNREISSSVFTFIVPDGADLLESE
jgi:outer membrane lipoprotein carrier protein